MSNITQFPAPQNDVLSTLETAKVEAQEVDAKKAIILLIHGENEIRAVCSHDFHHHDWYGHLGLAMHAATVRLAHDTLGDGDDAA